jgi:hypothetical protein
MTTTLQVPLFGTCHSPSSFVHLTSSPNLPFLDDPTPSGDSPQQQTPGPDLHDNRSFPDSGLCTTLSFPQLSCSSTSHQGSYNSNPTISLSLHIRYDTGEDGDLGFPSYEASGLPTKQAQITQTSPKQDDHPTQLAAPVIETATHLYKTPRDDQDLLPEPTSHVDYLSHEWNEEDIWLSWSYVIHRRETLANHVRLENALWRSWMKNKNHLTTMPPEALNWFKDYDVTWLYGPHQTEGKRAQFMRNASSPLSCLSDSASSIPKKSILKKNPSLVCLNMSTPLERKHVQFDKEVRQMQAVDSEEDDEDGECALTMSPSLKVCLASRNSSRQLQQRCENESPLPSTTLEYRTDTPEHQETAYDQTGHWTGQRSRSLSLPQAVSGPVGSSHNFLIDDNFDEVEELWQGDNTSNDKRAHCAGEESEYVPVPRTGWTNSRKFKQYVDDKEDDTTDNTPIRTGHVRCEHRQRSCLCCIDRRLE